MMTKCWRCKGAIDTMKVDTVETVGLCQSCWDKSSVDEPGRPVDTMTDLEYAQKKLADAVKIPTKYLGNEPKPNPLEVEEDFFIPTKEQAFAEMKEEAATRSEKYRNANISPEQYVHDPPWDDTEVRPKDKNIIEANYSALEQRVAAQLENEVLERGMNVRDDGFGSPFHRTVGMARLEQALSEAIYQASRKFHNTNDFDSVREEVKKASVKTLLDNVPNGFPPPPREVVEKLVDDCLTKQFGPPGTNRRSTSFRV